MIRIVPAVTSDDLRDFSSAAELERPADQGVSEALARDCERLGSYPPIASILTECAALTGVPVRAHYSEEQILGEIDVRRSPRAYRRASLGETRHRLLDGASRFGTRCEQSVVREPSDAQ